VAALRGLSTFRWSVVVTGFRVVVLFWKTSLCRQIVG